MNLLQEFPNLIKQICLGLNAIGNWFTNPLITINGFQIIPLYCILPASLLVILGVVAAHLVFDW